MYLAKYIIIALICFGQSYSVYAQDREYFPNEYLEKHLASKVVFKDTPLLIEIEDTIKENEIYIAHIYWGSYVHNTCLLVDEAQHWRVFSLHEEHLDYSFKEVNLSPKSGLEILIEFNYGSGRSGWRSGYTQLSWGFMVVDLEHFSKLFDWEEIQCYTYWENELEENEEDSEKPIEVVSSSGIKELGTQLEVSIKPGKLPLKEVIANCQSEFTLSKEEREAELERLEKLDPIFYSWDKDGMKRVP